MKGWKEVTLADICSSMDYGYTASSSEDPVGPHFLRITDIATGRVNWGDVPYCKIDDYDKTKYKLSVGDIVIARTGASTGATYVIKESDPENLVFASYLIRYRVNKIIALPSFIGALLTSTIWKSYVDGVVGGSAQPGANAKVLGAFSFNLPSLPEQRAIASVLSSLDDKIDLLHRQNTTLEKMAEALFRQWFVEEASDDWEERKLGDIVSISRGASPRPIIKYVKNGTIPWIKIADATSSSSLFITKTNEYIIEEGVSKSIEVYPGDLILSNSATCGLPYIVNIYGCIHDGWLLFRKFDVLPKTFILFLLKYIAIELNQIADGSVQDNLNTNILKNYAIKIPNRLKLDNFNSLSNTIMSKIKTNTLQIQSLEKLRDTLLPKLMSGEVRVQYKDAE